MSWTPCPSSQPAQPVRPDWLSPLPPNLALSLPPSLPPSLAVWPVARKAFPTLPPKPSPQSRRYLLSLLRCLIPPFPNTISNLFPLSTPARPRRSATDPALSCPRLYAPAPCSLYLPFTSPPELYLRSAPFYPPISTLGSGPSIFTTHPRLTPSRDRLAPPRPRAPRLHHHSCSDDDAPSPGLVFSAEVPRLFDVSFACPRVGGVLHISTESQGSNPRRHSTSPQPPRPARLGERHGWSSSTASRTRSAWDPAFCRVEIVEIGSAPS